MKSTKKHPNGHYAVSVRAAFYERLADAAERRGVSLTQIVHEVLCPILGVPQPEHRLRSKNRTDRRIDVTGRAYAQIRKIGRATGRSNRDVLDEEISRALDQLERL